MKKTINLLDNLAGIDEEERHRINHADCTVCGGTGLVTRQDGADDNVTEPCDADPFDCETCEDTGQVDIIGDGDNFEVDVIGHKRCPDCGEEDYPNHPDDL